MKSFLLGCATVVLFGCETTPTKQEKPPEPMSRDEQIWHDATYRKNDSELRAPEGKSTKRGFVISRKEQRICFFDKGTPVRCGPASTGTPQHPTPAGRFSVKPRRAQDVLYISHSYPKETNGGALMPYSIRFYGGYYIHLGPLPGQPASHGCVRVSPWDAKEFFEMAKIGDSVVVL